MGTLEGIRTIEEFEFEGKVVFLRLDLNLPMKNGKITDKTRLNAALPTIEYLLGNGAKLIIASHLGRPKSADDKEFSLEPVGRALTEALDIDVHLVDEVDGETPKALVPSLKKNMLILLENLRFHPGEKENSEKLARVWAEYTDIYINDAFGACHRAHASIDQLPKLMGKEKGIGFLIGNEIKYLDTVMDGAEKPYVTILGGAKVSDKIQVIEKLIDQVDAFIIGGAMSYTFLKAKGLPIGNSLIDMDSLTFCRDLFERLEARGKEIHLPIDHIVSKDIKDTSDVRTTLDVGIDEGWIGCDIGPKTIELYRKVLAPAKTVFWNGPMGIFEIQAFSGGTMEIAKILASINGTTIVGGGDSAAAVNQSGNSGSMTHISTGGGASLEYLQGITLPGLKALMMRR